MEIKSRQRGVEITREGGITVNTEAVTDERTEEGNRTWM